MSSTSKKWLLLVLFFIPTIIVNSSSRAEAKKQKGDVERRFLHKKDMNTVLESLATRGTISIGEDLDIEDDVNFNNNLTTFNGEACFNDDVNIVGGGNLTVTGTTSFYGTLGVVNKLTAEDICAAGILNVQGLSMFENVNVHEDLTVTDSLTVYGDTTLAGEVCLTGDVNVVGGANLTVTGSTSMYGVLALPLVNGQGEIHKDNGGVCTKFMHANGVGSTFVGELSGNVNTGDNNSAFGFSALTNNKTGEGNIALGFEAGKSITITDNNIMIGNTGSVSDDSTIRFGTTLTHTSCYIAGISGTTIASGATVIVDTSGQLGTMTSSREFKKDIKDMSNDETCLLMDLRPVTFVYKDDDTEAKQYGLIAEEVAEIFPELVVYNNEGKPQTIRYHVLSSILLDGYQQQNLELETQQKEINELRNEVIILKELLLAVSP